MIQDGDSPCPLPEIMATLASLQAHLNLAKPPIYRCQANLDLFDSPNLERLATQAAKGRLLTVESLPSDLTPSSPTGAIAVCLCEDDYPGWLSLQDLSQLELCHQPYQPPVWSESDIRSQLPAVIQFAQTAMAHPNHYLWGGTVGPHYDCSGLMQAAFAAVGIWLPRDAYQQEAFVQPIARSEVTPGDLIFFGPPAKATHVGLYLGDDCYIHSSGKDQGRNGIGIDRLSPSSDRISQTYLAQVRGSGRVVASYIPSRR